MNRYREEPDGTGAFSSPPCFMHEVDPVHADPAVDARQWADVRRWRKAERQRHLAARLAIDAGERQRRAEGIAANLDRLLGDAAGRTVGVYWPFRAEPDLRSWMREIGRRGATCALPVAVEKGRPLEFRIWHPGARLARDVWNIPHPADGAVTVPDFIVAPVVAFDEAGFRLGYGGGFYDRTLAAMPDGRFVAGVGYGAAAIPTIYPQPHDVPMDAIVTETRTMERRRDPAR